MQLSISEEVLSILICPETKQSLRLVSEAELAAWTSDEPFEGALVTADGTRAYPIRNRFPHLVESERLRPSTGSGPAANPV